jgi:uncharacterized repeat protein (TIGR01451 family)
MKQFLTFVFSLLFLSIQAQGFDKTLNEKFQLVSSTATKDGGIILTGFIPATSPLPPQMYIIKLDVSGNKQWSKVLLDMTPYVSELFPRLETVEDRDGNFWSSVSGFQKAPGLLTKLDKNGVVLLSKSTALTNIDIDILDNDIFIFGQNFGSLIPSLVRWNSRGDSLSMVGTAGLGLQRFPFYGFTIQKNSFLIYHNSDSTLSTQTRRYRFDGTLISTFNGQSNSQRQPFVYMRLFPTSDGGYIVADDSTNVSKIDSVGRFVWRKNNLGITPVGFPPFINSSLIAPKINSNEFVGIRLSQRPVGLDIRRFTGDGNIQNSNFFSFVGTIESPNLERSKKGGLILACNTQGTKLRIIKLDENGYFYPNFIKGNVFSDRDIDCKLSGNDIPIQRVTVVAKRTGFTDVLALTDTLGKYNLNVDFGEYNVSIVNPNPYMQACTPSVLKVINSNMTTDSADFALKSSFSCAIMQVDVSTPRLRRCFNNNYTVSYCNKGTATATGAYVNITLDSLLEFVSADKTVASKTGRTYRFNLGDIALNDCKTFDIVARVRCGDSTRLNQTLCVEAKIFPDTCGADNSLWSGANLTVNGSCLGDTVVFVVSNTGRAIAPASQATVVENLAARTVNIPALSPNSVFSQRFASNNNTWRMMVNQVANHPRSTQPTTFVEGCRRNSTTNFATGFAAGFANDDAHSSIDMDCQTIIGAYDPNDKTGYPLGTGATKAIGQNQDIEYIIRFQNTGTDTAFTVVIRDTIDIVNLDIKSIEWGASSHKYVPEIYRENILKFTFDNILLVDSFKNEPKSNGFVKFRIKQQKDVAFGTKIQNNAGIYFDFNDPVITNKTLHTVSKSVVSAIFDRDNSTYETIKFSPNPLTETAVFELKTPPLSISTFELYDVMGKRIIEQPFSGKTFEFQRKNLTTGVYVFKIMNDGKTLGVGKLMIQ